jgi:hypothetical protein
MKSLITLGSSIGLLVPIEAQRGFRVRNCRFSVLMAATVSAISAMAARQKNSANRTEQVAAGFGF